MVQLPSIDLRLFVFQEQDVIRDIGVTGLQSCVFFFSSRRRHTRYWRDWSSDVCSSDLAAAAHAANARTVDSEFVMLRPMGLPMRVESRATSHPSEALEFSPPDRSWPRR